MNRNRLAMAITASLAMSNTVWAVSCPSPIGNLITIPNGTTVSATADACTLAAGESIEVAVGGAITVNLAAGSTASAIIVPDGVAAGGIDMAGTLTVGATNNLRGIRVGIDASLTGPIDVSGGITVESSASSFPVSVTGSVPAGIQVSGTLSALSPPPSTSGSPVGIQLSGDGAWTPVTVESTGVVSGQFFGIQIFGAGTPGTPSTLTNHGEIREPTGAAFGGGIELIQSHRLATLTNHNLIQGRGVRNTLANHAVVVSDFIFGSGSEIDVFTNTGTVTAIDGGNGVYVAQKNSRINTLDNEIGAAISAVNTGSGVVTEGLIGTLTNRGTISGAVSGIGVQDFNDYYYGLDPSGRIDTLINLGTIAGGVFDIDAPERDLAVDLAPIGTLINAQTDLTYRGTLPENYRIIITSTTEYGSLDAVPGPSLMSFDISADDSVITPNFLYTGVLKGIGAGLLAQTTGVTEGIAWTLLGNPDNSWDLCTGPVTDGQCQIQQELQAEPLPVPIGKPGWFLLLVALLGVLGIRNLNWPHGRH